MVITWFINLILLLFSTIFVFPGVTTDYIKNLETQEYLRTQDIISADKAVVLSEEGRFLLFSKNSEEVQPIASITKLMTALVFLETNPNWNELYKISARDHVSGGKVHLFRGDTLTLRELFFTSLVASDNGATLALVHASGLSEKEFVNRMNEKAKELRLLQTSFSDPIGLSENNVSTARETALLTLAAYQEDMIQEAIGMKDFTFTTREGREKFIESTDYLLFDKSTTNFTSKGGKTGYIEKAGYCFSGIFEGPDGEIFVASVLNSEDKNGRFKESKAIINWVLSTYLKDK